MGNKCDMFDELQVTEDEGRAKAPATGKPCENHGKTSKNDTFDGI